MHDMIYFNLMTLKKLQKIMNFIVFVTVKTKTIVFPFV